MATLPWIVDPDENAPTFSIFRSALNLRSKTNCTVARSSDAVRGLAETLDRVLFLLLGATKTREAHGSIRPVGKMDVLQPCGKPVRPRRFDFASSRNRIRISDRTEWDGMGSKRNETKRNARSWLDERGGEKIVAPRDRKMEDYRGKGGGGEERRWRGIEKGNSCNGGRVNLSALR